MKASRHKAIGFLTLVVVSLSGCAGWRMYQLSPDTVPNLLTNPTRSQKARINFLQLRQDPPKAYFLGPGDILGVYIEGIIGSEKEPPPVQIPEDESGKPAIGYPIPVRDDGRIALPMIEPLYVAGATVAEAEQRIRDAYVSAGILRPERARIIVTLMRKRTYNILVVREDTESINISSGGRGLILGSTKKGKTYSIHLPAYENDVLHALSETGGLPGEDAKNEIVILRGVFADAQQMPYLLEQLSDETGMQELIANARNVTRIPIRVGPGEKPPQITQQDIILHDGDVVLIQGRETEVFYTGGLLQAGQHPLPRDYDIDILDAIAIAGGQLATAPGGQAGALVTARYGGGYRGSVFPPTDCRIIRTIGGQQYQIKINLAKAVSGNDPTQRVIIQPGDVIILQYRPHEVVLNSIMTLVDSATFGLFGFWAD